jgi:hypothetical protein
VGHNALIEDAEVLARVTLEIQRAAREAQGESEAEAS